jgi:hypothetical protein
VFLSVAGIDYSSFDESASPQWSLQWLSLQLHRAAESRDLFAAGLAFFERGQFRGAATMLQLYVDGAGDGGTIGGGEAPGLHLLAHAYAHCEDKRRCIAQAKRVVNCGFDADWQLLVEMQIDSDRENGMMPQPPAHIQPPT